MANKKIAFIGAGSMCFAPRIIKDFAMADAIHGCTLCLMDRSPSKLSLTARWAEEFYRRHHIDIQVQRTSNLAQAVRGAHFVIISVSADRLANWKKDLRIPKSYGITQFQSENGGPGGLAHGLRSCSIVLDICRTVEKHAPDAIVLNLTNPMMRVCTAIREYTDLRFAGLCHQAYNKTRQLAVHLLDLPFEQVHTTVGGLNHFTWAMQIRQGGTGKDLYPLLDEKIQTMPPTWEPLTRELYHAFRLWSLSGDNHVHEYLPYFHTAAYNKTNPYNLEEPDWKLRRKREQNVWRDHMRQLAGKDPYPALDGKRSGEYADRILSAVIRDDNTHILSLNIPNNGCIDNLPDKAIVEVPCIVNANGIHGVHVGALPRAVASLCERQIDINELTAQAAAEGSREKALHALLLDPMINDLAVAGKILDRYLAAFSDLLPQFG